LNRCGAWGTRGIEVIAAKRLQELEKENARLKRLAASGGPVRVIAAVAVDQLRQRRIASTLTTG